MSEGAPKYSRELRIPAVIAAALAIAVGGDRPIAAHAESLQFTVALTSSEYPQEQETPYQRLPRDPNHLIVADVTICPPPRFKMPKP